MGKYLTPDRARIAFIVVLVSLMLLSYFRPDLAKDLELF